LTDVANPRRSNFHVEWPSAQTLVSLPSVNIVFENEQINVRKQHNKQMCTNKQTNKHEMNTQTNKET
jgi:hypothetical protein